MSGRVIVIGIDGAPWKLLEPWMEQGDLPNIQRIREHGASGDLKSTYPPDSIPAWPSMLTGKNPGKHGIFEFRERDESIADPQPVYEHGPWQFAEDATMAFVNVPGTYPLVKHGFDGYCISGLFTPESDWEDMHAYTYPDSLADELADVVDDYHIDLWGTEEHGLLKRAHKSVDQRATVFKYILEKKDVDLFWGVFTEPDRLMHRFWAYQDEEHPLYDGLPEDDGRRDALRQHFMHIDEKVGELLELVDEDDYVMLVSDHGFQPGYQVFDAEEFLSQKGYLTFEENQVKNSLANLGFHRGAIQTLFNYLGGENLLERLPKTLRIKLRYIANRSLPAEEKNIDVKTDDSKVRTTGGVCFDINTESQGGPVPDNRRGDVRNQLVEDLRLFMEEHNLGGYVLPSTSVLDGPHTAEGPDVYYLFENVLGGRTKKAGVILSSIKDVSSPGELDIFNAWHDMDGIYALQGPDVEAGSKDASIYDVLPTVLHLLGEPVPADSDGAVLEGLSSEDAVRKKHAQPTELGGIDI